MLKQETEKYKQTIIGYFKQYMDWIRTSVSIFNYAPVVVSMLDY